MMTMLNYEVKGECLSKKIGLFPGTINKIVTFSLCL